VIFTSKKTETASTKETPIWGEAAAVSPYKEETLSPKPASRTAPAMKTEKTILTAETEFKGTLGFHGDLDLNGKLEGSIEADNGLLTIGESAMVKAEVHGQDIVIYGKVQGNIIASGRLELRGKAQVYGDVRAGKFLIEEGALFVGRSENLAARNEEKPDFSQMFSKLGETKSSAKA